MLEKYGVGLRALLRRVSGPGFCGDLVYGFGGIVGKYSFSEQFVGWEGRWGWGGGGCLLTVVKELAMAWMLCGRLCAWLSARSLLVAVLRSLVERRFGPRARWQPLRRAFAVGLRLDDMSLAWPAVVQLLVFICSGIELGLPWVLVFVCCGGWFDFYVFALMRGLGWEP